MIEEQSHILLTGNKQSTKTFETFVSEWKQQDSWIHNLYDRISKLEEKVVQLERPLRWKKLYELLSQEGKPRSARWIHNRIQLSYKDLDVFKSEHKLYSGRSGCTEMYSLTEIDFPQTTVSSLNEATNINELDVKP
jgi:hypothetical protein